MNILHKLKKIGTNGGFGYEAFFIFLAIGFVVLFFWPRIKYSPPKEVASVQETCVHQAPHMNKVIEVDGEKFGLIKPQAPVNAYQEYTHLHLCSTITYEGKERQVCKATRGQDGRVSTSVWDAPDGDASVFDLRFIEVTDTVSNPVRGNAYVDIYTRFIPEKNGYPIPEFIKNYCQKEMNASALNVLKDQSNNSFPPKEIDASKISNWHCESSANNCDERITKVHRSGMLYLYAYESEASPFLEKSVSENGFPRGDVTVLNAQNVPQSFSVFQPVELESQHISLIAEDPRSPGRKVGYRYAPLARLKAPDNPDLNLNERDTEKDSLQIQTFTPFQLPNTGWWTPECKPAIYLYPKTKMNVNVKVNPQGHFTYTDPVYDIQKGWNVTAYPDGTLVWLDNVYGINSKGEKRPTNFYDYLYYESKIHDSLIKKPENGFIVAYDDLEKFYHTSLPKLGLNEKETQDYVKYWINILPQSDYYFIGLLSLENVNEIEPMTITPRPDKTLRVRLYYEALTVEQTADKRKNLQSPKLEGFSREGFTVVEWGGMVKQDKDHPFTCSI